jgi:hypothetical protein
MSEPRIVTVEEANALVPKLTELVGRQLARADEIEAMVGALRDAAPSKGGGQPALQPLASDSADVRARKVTLAARIEAYERGWREVEALGVVVKDARAGLVDFYGRIDGRVVWLCWQHGETSVGFYHELSTGFGGRKPIDEDTRRRTLN